MANTGNSNSGNFANDREKASEAGKKEASKVMAAVGLSLSGWRAV